MSSVSIIIPTFNEAHYIEATLAYLKILSPPPKEIIIVDGNSRDQTLAIVNTLLPEFSQLSSVQLVRSSPSRANQLNQGAQLATSNYLCFLHADTLVPHDLVAVIRRTLWDGRIACGGFISIMSGAAMTRWGISLHNALKTYYAPLIFRPYLFVRKKLRVLFGDQVIFCRRRDFLNCGGFDVNLPIMEEADLCLRLCHYGEIRQINRIVQSSDRRVAQWGIFKANFIYLMIGCLWSMGISAQWLKQFYEDIR